jgi:hypothetical protein
MAAPCGTAHGRCDTAHGRCGTAHGRCGTAHGRCARSSSVGGGLSSEGRDSDGMLQETRTAAGPSCRNPCHRTARAPREAARAVRVARHVPLARCQRLLLQLPTRALGRGRQLRTWHCGGVAAPHVALRGRGGACLGAGPVVAVGKCRAAVVLRRTHVRSVRVVEEPREPARGAAVDAALRTVVLQARRPHPTHVSPAPRGALAAGVSGGVCAGAGVYRAWCGVGYSPRSNRCHTVPRSIGSCSSNRQQD